MGQRQDCLADELVRKANTLTMDPSTKGDSSSKTKKKCWHWHSRNINVDMYVQRHEKILITIHEKVGKLVGVFATKFSNAIGTATRDTISVHCSKWKDVSSDVIVTIKARLQPYFVVCMSSMFINKLLNKEDWEALCDCWETPEGETIDKDEEVDQVEFLQNSLFKEGWVVHESAKESYVAMQEEITKSSEDGSEPTPEAIICEWVLGNRLGHTKGLG
ncbi:CACTA en-spm transposon protein [Cucumis melo var. makuwa]|nr:CACTA en-spm transposon protein [Cucumis melo var. makuwa]